MVIHRHSDSDGAPDAALDATLDAALDNERIEYAQDRICFRVIYSKPNNQHNEQQPLTQGSTTLSLQLVWCQVLIIPMLQAMGVIEC